MKIAMWSGPRNLSTALMYSFAARGDCAVWDEPFYAAYLAATELDHPMRQEIMAAGELDADRVAAECLGRIPGGRQIHYQKHMAHHMLPDFPREWLSSCANVFLIRHPARVIASYAIKREAPVFEDLGFERQLELFETAAVLSGNMPPVIDTHDLRDNPAGILKALCRAIDLPYTDRMLSWPAGGHASDGVWARHWYGAVHKSTGFAEPEPELPVIDAQFAPLLERAMPIYKKLSEYALTAER